MRTDVIRALFWKRGWRTYLFAAVLGLVMAIKAGTEDGLAPFLFLGVISLGVGWRGLTLRRKVRR